MFQFAKAKQSYAPRFITLFNDNSMKEISMRMHALMVIRKLHVLTFSNLYTLYTYSDVVILVVSAVIKMQFNNACTLIRSRFWRSILCILICEIILRNQRIFLFYLICTYTHTYTNIHKHTYIKGIYKIKKRGRETGNRNAAPKRERVDNELFDIQFQATYEEFSISVT